MDPSLYTYTQKSQSLSSWRSPRRSSRSSQSQQPPRLGAISEDGATIQPDIPPLPPRAHNRPLQRMFHLGLPPLYGAHGEKTPEYGEDFHNFSDVKGPRGEDFQDLRHNRHITKRGGWKRLVLIAAVVLAVVIGLGIGLGLGLSKKNKDSPPESSSSPAGASPNQTFPLGSYTFLTFLSTVLTPCTPNPATWSCFPYQSYNESTTGSSTSFNWIITSSDLDSSNPANWLISSSKNPFALTFANTSMRLLDPGLESEALSFSVPMQKIVIPNGDISGDGSASRCLYNDTEFTAKLYTKMAKTYPPEASAADVGAGRESSSSEQFQPWPYAVEISQTIGSGSGVPDCYKTENGQLREQVDLAGTSANGDCECGYLNFGT